MKRSRPKQHTRTIKTKKGKKRILINKGRKKTRRKRKKYPYSSEQVKYVQGIINNKRRDNIGLSNEASKVRKGLDSSFTIRDKTFFDTRLSNIKRHVASNNDVIDRLETRYELGTQRRKNKR